MIIWLTKRSIFCNILKRSDKMRKIVGISSGSRNIDLNGNYELKKIDSEIVKLSNKEMPNFLFLAHALDGEQQVEAFKEIKKVYSYMFNCKCRLLKKEDLENIQTAKEMVDWADIIYESGGDTLNMVYLWKRTGFDKVLEEASNDGKVMCGESAGASCWFNGCITDSLRIIYDDEDKPLVGMDCLNFVDLFCVPHGNMMERYVDSKDLLERNQRVGLLLASTSIEIVGKHYRIIPNDIRYSEENVIPFALKMYWKDGEYIEEAIDMSEQHKSLSSLLEKKTKEKIKVYRSV